MLKSKYGIGLLSVLLFLVLGYGMYAFYFGRSAASGDSIILREDGKEILRMDDFRKMEDGVYPFRYLKGEGALEIQEGKVRMVEMDKVVCPEGICSDTGYTDSVYKPIVCLPNRLILTVEASAGADTDILGG